MFGRRQVTPQPQSQAREVAALFRVMLNDGCREMHSAESLRSKEYILRPISPHWPHWLTVS